MIPLYSRSSNLLVLLQRKQSVYVISPLIIYFPPHTCPPRLWRNNEDDCGSSQPCLQPAFCHRQWLYIPGDWIFNGAHNSVAWCENTPWNVSINTANNFKDTFLPDVRVKVDVVYMEWNSNNSAVKLRSLITVHLEQRFSRFRFIVIINKNHEALISYLNTRV